MRKFKTESKKLLDLMINSIYTNREIFLRELISNASDAVDKLYFKSLTDSDIQLSKDELGIMVSFDKDARTVTVSDSGIGMDKDDLDRNLGTIAHSDSMAFKEENAEQQGEDVDIIGQFGVGFYSAFMVAKKVRVVSKAYGSDQAWAWESDGVEGYTIEEAERESHGTDVILTLKDNTDEEDYDSYLSEYGLKDLIKRYSNYVRYPIQMMVTKTREKPKPEDAPSHLFIVGRYLLSPRIMELLATQAPGAGNEIQLTDSMQRLLAEEEVYALVVDPAEGCDTGTPAAWAATNARMAIKNPQTAEAFREALGDVTLG